VNKARNDRRLILIDLIWQNKKTFKRDHWEIKPQMRSLQSHLFLVGRNGRTHLSYEVNPFCFSLNPFWTQFTTLYTWYT